MKRQLPSLAFLTTAALACATLHAEVMTNPLFSDGAVLQQGLPMPVWGMRISFPHIQDVGLEQD